MGRSRKNGSQDDMIPTLLDEVEAHMEPSPHMDERKTPPSESPEREVRFEHSVDFADLLAKLNTTLLVSTYQAGKLAVIGSQQRKLTLSFHNFDRPMGVAVDPRADRLAVAARDKVWFLRNARDIAPQVEPAGTYEACFVTRTAQVTGEIQSHEMEWGRDELWIVNTLFSCLCTLDNKFSFVPRWQPPFVSNLAPEDRCHLNGLAMLDGRAKYVTVMAETDTAGGWRPTKAETGCLIDVDSNETIARGFAMPHSPRVHMGHIWVLDSGRGELVRVDPRTSKVETVARFPGYTRGLALHDTFAFVGLSKIRETSTFGGVPIAEDRERLKCGVGVVDLTRGELVGQFEFKSGVDEIFDVSLLPGIRSTAMRGPFAFEDGANTIWLVPRQEDITPNRR
jgi:uncharacterized protein (TIGR03032 family)